MILLVVLVVTGIVTSCTAVAALVAVRRRLATELALARGTIAAEIGARDEVKGLLGVAQEARARAEEALSRELGPLQQEIARLAASSAGAEERYRGAAASLREVESKLTSLTTSSAAATRDLTARAARLTTARAAAEEGHAELAKQRAQILADLESAKRACADADEARRLAEEEARIARTAKESFAGEARLLREEIQKVQARLEEATRRREAPLVPVAVKAKELTVKHTITWWCVDCNLGGSLGLKPHICPPEPKDKKR